MTTPPPTQKPGYRPLALIGRIILTTATIGAITLLWIALVLTITAGATQFFTLTSHNTGIPLHVFYPVAVAGGISALAGHTLGHAGIAVAKRIITQTFRTNPSA